VIIFGLFFTIDNSKNITQVKTVALIRLSEVDYETFAGFKTKMQSYGWNENINIRYIDTGAAKTVAALPSIVSKVISKKPDLILVASTPATQEVKRQTVGSSIPIVFCPVNDPVASNIVLNPNAPEGHITGIRLPMANEKRFEWLYKIAPNIKNVLVPYTPYDDSANISTISLKKIIQDLNLNINIIEVAFPPSMTFNQFIKKVPKNIDAIFVPTDSSMAAQIKNFTNYAIEHKIPLSGANYKLAKEGALYVFGFMLPELGKKAARMVDRILRGVKPADLPVKYGNSYLILNEKTAKSIGIEFSPQTKINAKLIIE